MILSERNEGLIHNNLESCYSHFFKTSLQSSESMEPPERALHFVFKIADRNATM